MKSYEEPVVTVSTFCVEDIVTVSGGTIGGGTGTGGNGNYGSEIWD